jgi:hypothetical protein
MATETQGTCFVVMGFGKKTDFETGRTLDLDKSYRNMIKPSVEAAGLQCIRADEIQHAGVIDVPMYQQLLNADVVVADLSTSNKNAFYELGVRHALRPFTTVVISEDGAKTFPFDINHVVVRQYHHLGEDIGFDEVMRFRKLLTDAIVEIQKVNPRQSDSPVYTFLNGLTPPTLAAVKAAAAEATRSVEALETPQSFSGPAPEAPTISLMMQQVDEAQAKGDFIAAKSFLTFVRGMMKAQAPSRPEDPYIIQRLALLTYKSKHPTEEAALKEAQQLLMSLNPETSNDTETLGLWGSVHKRLWDVTHDPAALDQAVRGYRRGFYLRNDFYNGINYAYVLNLRAASSADPAEAIADFVQARRIRKEVLEICEKWLADNPAPESPEALKKYRQDRYWVLATMAEAAVVAGDETGGQAQLATAIAEAPEPWMGESTREQIGKLQKQLADSPLKHINTAAAQG